MKPDNGDSIPYPFREYKRFSKKYPGFFKEIAAVHPSDSRVCAAGIAAAGGRAVARPGVLCYTRLDRAQSKGNE